MKRECKKLLTEQSLTNCKSGVFGQPNLCYGQPARTQQLVTSHTKLLSTIPIYIHSCTHSHFLPNNPKSNKMASSLPQFYADFTTFSGETSSQFHGSSSCPDVNSALSSYLDDYYGSFNTSSNPESIFLPQVLGISDVSVPEYNSNYYQKMGVNNATHNYFHGGDQEYYGFSPEIKPLFRPAIGEQSWVSMHVTESNTNKGCMYCIKG